ncbi:Glycosyl transferase family 1 [Methylocella tundrae]|uniref:Glycosyl transferase family 1 n=1 Tax=Methylocella tundrae TaxID=227605 RepID=A0A8B6M489_METTU|nr:FtsX-like permease family protein [Methylocella tundrae]VTZ22293.1 Glycosyl transferase family 1 [Methylocella tundrae]VTZ49616.1 Glycosyl transferase family 1 [Methylocella tundrae]
MNKLGTAPVRAKDARAEAGRATRLPFVLRVAWRDLRGGLGGFGIFLGCIALGVAAIVGVESVSLSLQDGLARDGRAILGGDLSFDLAQREATASERAFLAASGRLSSVALMRAMARRPNGEAAMVEIKAVDALYPLAGEVGLEPEQSLDGALSERDGVFGVAVDAALLPRLNLAIGDLISIGDARYQLRALLTKEPDQLAGGVGFGPRVMMSEAGLRATGLLQPGALTHWLYRVALGSPSAPAGDAAVDDAANHARADLPDAGWEVRTRKNISPQFSRNLDRFTQFLTLVGLTSLIIGGVGVANAIRAHVERKRQTIATLKSLGASGAAAFAMMLTEVMLVACLGIAFGALIGAAMPFIAVWGFGALLPFPLVPSIHPSAIGEGALYGFLTALSFSVGPLGVVHDVPAQAIFRESVEPLRAWPRPRYISLTLAAACALVAAALLFSSDRKLALIYLGATLAAFVLLRLVALAIMFFARKLPHPRNVALRLAIGNIHRPGALTASVVLSLGLGLALLVTLALIDGNLRGELKAGNAGTAPSFFFLDVQGAEAGAFTQFLKERAPDGKIELVPMLRGRIVKLNGLSTDLARPKESAAWALRGDRGVTFADSLPAGSTLVKGQWWPKDYSGPPLISLESEIADGLGLEIGDEIAVNVLGRTIVGAVANIRKVNWRSFGINFVLIFSPNTFAGAPYTDLATLTFPAGADQAREMSLLRESAAAFPAVTSIRVKDALEAASAILAELAAAVRGASSVALLASILVLGGAVAAGQQARVHDAVVLKTLGATRGRLLAAFLYEYGLIGFATALFGVAAGAAAAYGVLRKIMDLDFIFFWREALGSAAAALILTILLGLMGTFRILGRKPGPYLRDL